MEVQGNTERPWVLADPDIKLDHSLIAGLFHNFTFSSSVRGLCVTLDSALTFTEHISSYYQLRSLRSIRSSVFSTVFFSTMALSVDASINVTRYSLGSQKVPLSSVQSVLNRSTAARLISRLARYSHTCISTYMIKDLNLLPVPSRIRYEVLLLIGS